jgi:thiamine kinase-like enzyme
MPLSQAEIVSYLMERELISMRSVVEGDLLVTDTSRRNQNYKVLCRRGASYIVKQGVTAEGAMTVAREAAIYEHLHAHPEGEQLRRYLPRFYGYEPASKVLILELVQNTQDLRVRHSQGRFSPGVARGVATVLTALHHFPVTPVFRPDNKQQGPGNPAWVLSAHRPEQGFLGQISQANHQLIKIVQEFKPLGDLLDELRAGWRTETVIHSDIKWDNFLVAETVKARQAPQLKLVDWELACPGDPRWDVAAVFNDYLSTWLNSIPITGQTPPERYMELARFPLSRMQPALRAFWQEYARGLQLDSRQTEAWFLAAVRYAGARLVQTTYEQMQLSTQLTGNMICQLQLGWNIMARPAEAATTLLGIEPGEGAHHESLPPAG